jgi:hypothetical protein
MTCLQFAEEFRDQFTAERLEYMNEIEDAIRNIVDERYKKGQGPSGINRFVETSISRGFRFIGLDLATCRFCNGHSN